MQRATWCAQRDKSLSPVKGFLCNRFRLWNALAFPAISDMCRAFSLDKPEGPADLKRWAGEDRARRSALEAAQAPCIDGGWHPCDAKEEHSKPAPRPMTAEEHVALTHAAYREAGGR